jgi:hypothetical protein
MSKDILAAIWSIDLMVTRTFSGTLLRANHAIGLVTFCLYPGVNICNVVQVLNLRVGSLYFWKAVSAFMVLLK